MKIKSVEVPSGFTYKVVGNKVSIENTEALIGAIANPGDYKFKINTSFKAVKDGTTIDNIATVDDYPTNTVSTKKGYAIQVEKAAANDHSKMLQGAEYDVNNSENVKLFTMTSNDQGIMSGNISEPGNYYLKEIKAPSGYELNNQVFTIDINGENAIKQQEITVKDNIIASTTNNNNTTNNNVIGNKGSSTNNGQSPQTGDSSELPMYVLLGLAVVGLVINAKQKKKDKKIAK